MFHGKIEQRAAVILDGDILDLIDLSSEELDELAKDDAKDDVYLGKDMQFHRVRINPTLAIDAEDSDDESYISEDILDLNLEEIEARRKYS